MPQDLVTVQLELLAMSLEAQWVLTQMARDAQEESVEVDASSDVEPR
jgi:hypothetical protein